ncbi:MAG: cytochrome c oxidase subunit 3 family protein [Desulfamplus sp.]|nr:cytochrome c oxidase subunit 3 family protein [Desulfamplus sp.]
MAAEDLNSQNIIDKPEIKQSDSVGSRTGMWLFLYTEIMLFGGLFVLYAAYYRMYTADFRAAGKELDIVMGTVNTILLLISSFAVAASITAIQRNTKKIAVAFLSFAILLGFIFLINKYFEWGHKINLGIFPNSPAMEDSPHGRVMFFALYYTITGLHGLHIIIGMTLLSVGAVFITLDKINYKKYVLLENVGLYWHLVDLIWIFIFPLFYLIY